MAEMGTPPAPAAQGREASEHVQEQQQDTKECNARAHG